MANLLQQLIRGRPGVTLACPQCLSPTIIAHLANDYKTGRTAQLECKDCGHTDSSDDGGLDSMIIRWQAELRLEAWQTRLLEERNNLQLKYVALDDFLNSHEYLDLPSIERGWLDVQFTVMKAYLIIVEERIKHHHLES